MRRAQSLGRNRREAVSQRSADSLADDVVQFTQWRAESAVPHPGLAVIPKLSLKLNVIQSLKALCDNPEEPLQFGLVANRTGRRAEHQHGVPGKTIAASSSAVFASLAGSETFIMSLVHCLRHRLIAKLSRGA